MEKRFLSITLILLSCVFLLSCKGDDGEVGPTGATGPAGATGATGAAGPAGTANQNFAIKEGFVKGTATGTMLSGAAYSYGFDFEGIYDVSDATYKVNSPTETEIFVYKTYAGDGTSFLYGSLNMRIIVTSLVNLTSPQMESINLNFAKDLGSNKVHVANSYTYSSFTSNGSTATVSNLVYNSSTGVLTGNYTFTYPADAFLGSLSIANGTFSTKLANEVARKAAK